MYKIAIIGGGASGFFTAINIAEQTKANVTIYEGSNKVLSKVLVSGGGRCNVTNTITDPEELVEHYPRGKDFLFPSFMEFSSIDTQKWFNQHGVLLKTEEDGRVFPKSNSSETIYKCLVDNALKNGVKIKTNHRLTDLKESSKGWQLQFKDLTASADVVVLATSCNKQIFKMLRSLHLKLVPQVPSLFTFKAKEHQFATLSGVSLGHARVSIKEVPSASQNGPLLLTHLGYSAPSILRLSAWHARELNELDYQFTLQICWDERESIDELSDRFKSYAVSRPKEKILNLKEHQIPKRLWTELVDAAAIKPFTNWSEIGKKGIARLIKVLTNFEVRISGKNTFKEEFVTAGGINLDTVSNKTFEISDIKNLYAVGELLDIDAITGGFNFQAAWTGGYLAAKAITHKINNSLI
jgi:predicted Rossmann fold flavoprotein